LRLVDRRGAAQTAVTDIVDALGITHRTVYRYFTGTDELFTAVAEVPLGS
jgi:AcrR family transcriptional regulator